MMDKPNGEEVPVTQNFLSATVTECDYMGDGRWCISVDQGEATFCWPDPLVTLQLDVAQSAPRRAARPLSDEAAFLRRLADPYGDGNPETQAEFANAVQEAVTEMGPGHWQDAYQELQPDWQPPPGDAAEQPTLQTGTRGTYNGIAGIVFGPTSTGWCFQSDNDPESFFPDITLAHFVREP